MRGAVDADVEDGVGHGVGEHNAANAGAGVVAREHLGLGAGLQAGFVTGSDLLIDGGVIAAMNAGLLGLSQ